MKSSRINYQSSNSRYRRLGANVMTKVTMQQVRNSVVLGLAILGSLLFALSFNDEQTEMTPAAVEYIFNPIRVVLEPVPETLKKEQWSIES
ncbi:hypothetical protein [Pleionea litopenaei]|uniref:Uncharacterized protein n=1 Tax=Pleionea litopenaei TaxID=3070815 RepID=A0AA51RVK3_9GAMM|nr:hypothetical protein [Pleionea sp. HL-JVS1]WMS88566.1 hypothetical protein Q9312_06515 [Pleionea sp. HL-JVS1]